METDTLTPQNTLPATACIMGLAAPGLTSATPYTQAALARALSTSSSGGAGIAYVTCDGDVTAAIDNALASLAVTGGELRLSGGIGIYTKQLVLPYDASGNAPFIRITGVGATYSGVPFNGTPPASTTGTVLKMPYSGTGAKICAFGSGTAEIDHITFVEPNTGTTTPWLIITNTNTKVHDCVFRGYQSYYGTNCVQDGIILGGTSNSRGLTADSQFSGYGTVIYNNAFDRIRRCVVVQSYACNSVFIATNSVSPSCGYSAGACFDILGGYANVFENNIIEIANYLYGFSCTHGDRNVFIENTCWDALGVTQASYYINYGAHILLDTFSDSQIPLVSGAGQTSVISRETLSFSAADATFKTLTATGITNLGNFLGTQFRFGTDTVWNGKGCTILNGWLANSGTWLNLGNDGPSCVGVGGTTGQPLVAYATDYNVWLAGSAPGDVCLNAKGTAALRLGSGNGLPTQLKLSGNQTTAYGGIIFSPVAYASLPAAPTDGMRCFVTDALVTAAGNFGAAIAAGGGANHVPVYYDGGGSTWRIG